MATNNLELTDVSKKLQHFSEDIIALKTTCALNHKHDFLAKLAALDSACTKKYSDLSSEINFLKAQISSTSASIISEQTARFSEDTTIKSIISDTEKRIEKHMTELLAQHDQPINSEISNIKKDIDQLKNNWKQVLDELSKLEKQLTSTQGTVNNIVLDIQSYKNSRASHSNYVRGAIWSIITTIIIGVLSFMGINTVENILSKKDTKTTAVEKKTEKTNQKTKTTDEPKVTDESVVKP